MSYSGYKYIKKLSRFNRNRKFISFASAYRNLLEDVWNKYDFITSPRDLEIKEIQNYSLTITNPLNNCFTNKVRSVDLKYLSGELIWYFTGDNSLEFISKFSKFWKKIANSNDTCNSAYGNLIFKEDVKNNTIFTEWSWALDSLLSDTDTRQAVIHFNKPWHIYSGNKDFPCTMYGVFQIRTHKDNKVPQLDFSIFMRSSDSIKGTTFDIPFFMILQQQMWKILNILNPQEKINLGEFYYHTNSQHIYSSDYSLVENMLSESFKTYKLPEIGENLIINKIDTVNKTLIEIKDSILNNTELLKTKPIKDKLLKFLYNNAIK